MSIHAIFRCGCEYYLHLFFNFCSFTFHDQTSKVLQYFASSDGSKTCEDYMEIEKSLNSLADTNGKTDSGEGVEYICICYCVMEEICLIFMVL